MKKIQFQNATQTAPATVTINGVNHDVTPAVIEGGTLPTPDNLNQLQNNVEAVLNGEESIEKLVVGDIECKNILSSDLIKGVYAYATGLFANSNVYVCTRNYIPVIAGKQITISTSYSSPEIGIVYYNDNNERITSKVGTSGIVPEGATKLVICIKKSDDATTISPSDVEWIQLEYGSKATSYVPHKKYGYNSTESMGKIVVDDIKCKNLFNINRERTDKYNIVSTVSENKLSTECTGAWSYLEYYNIKAEKGQIYTVSFDFSNPSNNSMGLDIRSATGSSILGSASSTDVSGSKKFSFIADDDVVTMRICSNNTGDVNTNTVTYSNIQIEKGSVITEYTPYKNFDAPYFQDVTNELVYNSSVSFTNKGLKLYKYGNVMCLFGSASFTSVPADTVILTIPAKYRTTDNLRNTVIGSESAIVYASINTDGTLVCKSNTGFLGCNITWIIPD